MIFKIIKVIKATERPILKETKDMWHLDLIRDSSWVFCIGRIIELLLKHEWGLQTEWQQCKDIDFLTLWLYGGCVRRMSLSVGNTGWHRDDRTTFTLKQVRTKLSVLYLQPSISWLTFQNFFILKMNYLNIKGWEILDWWNPTVLLQKWHSLQIGLRNYPWHIQYVKISQVGDSLFSLRISNQLG
jgi:hypothetical protein